MLFLTIFLVASIKCQEDYWDEDYDLTQNCVQKERIAELRAEVEVDLDGTPSSQCSSETVRGDDDEAKEAAFRACKSRLSVNLQKKCHFTAVNETGNLLYCSNRGIITCCFDQHACIADWKAMQHTVYKVAKEYLQSPKDYIAKKVLPMGYKTCHILNSSLDATPCARDCERFKKHRFARECEEKGGMFKCCVRRDAAFCHECRFCCTLAMCSYPSPYGSAEGAHNTIFDDQVCDGECSDHSKGRIQLKDQKNQQMASELFLSLQHMYKKWDYRCLVPYSHPDPGKWHTYDMHRYRTAFSKKMLKKVDTFKYDKNFNNWIDPDVMREFTKSTRSLKTAWKKSYSFPYVTGVQWDGADINTGDGRPCWRQCAKLETKSFKKACEKSGGFFKCCVTKFTLNIFETARNNLIKEGLIDDRQRKWCTPKGRKDPCYVCRAEGICTMVDIATGQTEHIFEKRYLKEHKVGGPGQTFQQPMGLRFTWCLIGDMCQFGSGGEYDSSDFRHIASKKELCTATKYAPMLENGTKTDAFADYCMKSKANNIFVCPKEKIENEIMKKETPATKAFKSKTIIKFNDEISKHNCCSIKQKKKYTSRGLRLAKARKSKKSKSSKKKKKPSKKKGKKRKGYKKKYKKRYKKGKKSKSRSRS